MDIKVFENELAVFEYELAEVTSFMTSEQISEAIEQLKHCRNEAVANTFSERKQVMRLLQYAVMEAQEFWFHTKLEQCAGRIMVSGAAMLNEELVRRYLSVIQPVKERWLIFSIARDYAVRQDKEIVQVSWNAQYYLRPALIVFGLKGRGLQTGNRVTIGGEAFTVLSSKLLLKDECIPSACKSGNIWQYRYKERGGTYEEIKNWYENLALQSKAEDLAQRTKNSTSEKLQ